MHSGRHRALRGSGRGWIPLATASILTLTMVGAIATSNCKITNNTFTKPDHGKSFALSGTAFSAEFDQAHKSAVQEWSVTNSSRVATAVWDGNFVLDRPLSPKGAKHLHITYVDSAGDRGSGGTFAQPVDMVTAFGGKPFELGPLSERTFQVIVTWDGFDPKPDSSFTVRSDFQASYDMNTRLRISRES